MAALRGLEPWALLNEPGPVTYRVDGEQMARLREAVVDIEQPIVVTLEGMAGTAPGMGPGRAGGQVMTLRGTVTAQVALACPRCLEPFSRTLRGQFEIAIRDPLRLPGPAPGETPAAETVVPDVDSVEVAPGERLDAMALVEDEALLALPFAPRCAREGCQAAQAAGPGDAPAPARTRPFAHLGEMMEAATDGRDGGATRAPKDGDNTRRESPAGPAADRAGAPEEGTARAPAGDATSTRRGGRTAKDSKRR